MRRERDYSPVLHTSYALLLNTYYLIVNDILDAFYAIIF